MCSNDSHSADINVYAGNIITACINAAVSAIPLVASRPDRERIPGWSEHVKPTRERSLFWHKIWIDCGRPRDGEVANCMRRTRAAYHYAIRKVRKEEERITRDRFAHALAKNDSRNFWAEVKRIRTKRHTVSRTVDGRQDASSIAALFASKYQQLYTSVAYDANDLLCVINDVDTQLLNCTFNDNIIKFS